jgi:hypothetical protein
MYSSLSSSRAWPSPFEQEMSNFDTVLLSQENGFTRRSVMLFMRLWRSRASTYFWRFCRRLELQWRFNVIIGGDIKMVMVLYSESPVLASLQIELMRKGEIFGVEFGCTVFFGV